MRHLKRVLRVVLLLIALLLVSTGLLAWRREHVLTSIVPGMSRAQVDMVLGPGRLELPFPGKIQSYCKRCPPEHEEFLYPGNPSLWYGNLEDELIVCYVDGVVCDTARIGL